MSNKEDVMQKLNDLIKEHNLTENMVKSIVDGEDRYVKLLSLGICRQIRNYVNTLSGGKKY